MDELRTVVRALPKLTVCPFLYILLRSGQVWSDYHSVLFCALLCCALLCYAMLYFTMLDSSLFYFAVLYCTLMCWCG